MRLRSLTKHLREQNWFAVALDFVIVVVGVGVALMGQQWLSVHSQRAEMARVAPTVQSDLLWNYVFAKERISVEKCRVDRYREIAAKLLVPSDDWTGMPFTVADSTRNDEFARPNALPLVLRAPSRPYGSVIWEAEMGRGTFNQMEGERRTLIDNTFQQGRRIEALQDSIRRLQGEIALLAVSATISSSDRQTYYNSLGKLDEMESAIQTMAGQLIEKIEDIGYEGPQEGAVEALSNLPKRNEFISAVYGDCYEPQTWPYFEAITANAATAEGSTP